ncbi:MAG: hypothetical protein ACHQO8_09595 [Vicinamibacterales bacterium]
MQFARNLGTGHGFSYNPGVRSSGSTAPLWTLVLAIPAALHLDLPTAAKVLGVALTIAAALAAREIVGLLTHSRLGGAIAGAAVVMSPRMTWASMSGMEVPLYCTLAMLTLLSYLRGLRSGRATFWPWLAGLTGTARPEAFMFVPIFVLHWAWCHRQTGAVRAALRPVVATGAVMAIYVAFNYYVGGHPLPATFYAKNKELGLLSAIAQGHWPDVAALGISQPIDFLNMLLKWADEQTPFLTLAVLVGALVLGGALPLSGADLRGGGIIVVLLLLAPMMKGAFVPAPPLLTQNARYIGNLLIMYFMIASVGLTYLWTATRRHWAVAVFIVVALARLASQDVKFAPRYAAEVQNINDLQVVTAYWVRSHTTPAAVIATNDIGALAFFGQRTIVDTEGLISPESVPYRRNKTTAAYLAQARPDLLIIFPGWYPELAGRSDILREVDRVTATKVVSWGESLVIYRMPWTRLETVPGLAPWEK